MMMQFFFRFLVSSSLLASLPKIVASKQNSVVKFQSF
jgi:hypothetical protein